MSSWKKIQIFFKRFPSVLCCCYVHWYIIICIYIIFCNRKIVARSLANYTALSRRDKTKMASLVKQIQ